MDATFSLVSIGRFSCAVSMWMTIRLGSRRRPGFSKTARFRPALRPSRFPDSNPRTHGPHLDAVGRDHRPVPVAIGRRRLADDLAERPAERPQAHEADV